MFDSAHYTPGEYGARGATHWWGTLLRDQPLFIIQLSLCDLNVSSLKFTNILFDIYNGEMCMYVLLCVCLSMSRLSPLYAFSPVCPFVSFWYVSGFMSFLFVYLCEDLNVFPYNFSVFLLMCTLADTDIKYIFIFTSIVPAIYHSFRPMWPCDMTSYGNPRSDISAVRLAHPVCISFCMYVYVSVFVYLYAFLFPFFLSVCIFFSNFSKPHF